MLKDTFVIERFLCASDGSLCNYQLTLYKPFDNGKPIFRAAFNLGQL
jgi:hypothetical protein